MSEEDEVMAELGEAAGGTASQEAAETPGTADENNAPAGESDQPLTKSQERAQRAAATRKRNKEKAEEQAAMKAKVLKDAGAVPEGVGVVDADLPEIPRDEDGNPLWYFNPKTDRVVPANDILNRPDMRKKKGLIPCAEPVAESDEEEAA